MEDEATELLLPDGTVLDEGELDVTAELRAEVLEDVVTEVVVDEVMVNEDVEVVEDVVRLVELEEVVEEPVDVDDEVDALAEEDILDEVETAVSGRAPRSNARRRGWATGVWTFVPREK
jgi:hypothetical protein